MSRWPQAPGGQRTLVVARIGWLLPGALLALFAVKALGPVRDPDTFWHLRAGEHLLSTGQFVLDDPFGAGAQRPWILNQWLPEVLLHGADAAFGLPGVAWLLCLATVLVGVCLWVACRRRSSALLTALVLAVAFVAMGGSLSPRPQLVTFGLAALTVDAWWRTLADGRSRWWLVPVTWLWACSHGMWFVGPGIGALAIVGGLLDGRWRPREAMRLGLVPLLSVAAAAVTPVGPRLFTSPFQVADVTPFVTEWQATSLGDPGLWATIALLVPVVVAIVRRRELRWTTTLFASVAVYLAFAHARTVALAAVLVAPLAASALQSLLPVANAPLGRRERVATLALPASALALVAALAPSVASRPALGAPTLDGPLAALPAGTRVCSDEAAGGWLEWAHPGLRPTMDTRVEIRTASRIDAYHLFVAGAEGWQAYPTEMHCGAALLTDRAPVVKRLVGAGWTRSSTGDGYVFLRAPR
ncbi:hypothetical protein [Intrasporangium sp. YIM S08009]|uniref:hypothetical protein n=1 Tax=Intrasporangium zincisolvens TaxID=3080018 RepID=UPI002B059109|nr:hypothetical protein [Intrasporangium sp. YIM S08009]